LSTLTVRYTDQYLRRAFSKIQTSLHPDTVFFLGDLFDGGREWSTRSGQSADKQWHGYGDSFWIKEYNRFQKIFLKHWNDGGSYAGFGQEGRKLIASLPGNHDLGFALGVQTAVRKRFNAYFGEGNRIDIVGNHTFVSVDSVSLSALGAENAGPESEELWKPVQEFLDGAKELKKRKTVQFLRTRRGENPNPQYRHRLVETDDLDKDMLPELDEPVIEFPTILLSHVPLWRAAGTPCGPMREHWPPSPPPKGQTAPLEEDERNAIALRAGYQYQNVLHPDVAKDITEKIGNIQWAFSGDDHDYCEVVHKRYASGGGGIREITVKSLSWAMGVRHPGFVMLSMWNPVDEKGSPISKLSSGSTIQTHLCLLPDQLGIFIHYATFFALTLIVLSARAILVPLGFISSSVQPRDENPLLPVSEGGSSAEAEKAEIRRSRSSSFDTPHEVSSNSSVASNRSVQHIRNGSARTRTGSPSGYALPPSNNLYGVPLVQSAGYFGPPEGAIDVPKWPKPKPFIRPKPKPLKGFALAWVELKWSISRVGGTVLIWYFWLIWNW
jgi:ethanolamine phosphate phosphodiesterase